MIDLHLFSFDSIPRNTIIQQQPLMPAAAAMAHVLSSIPEGGRFAASAPLTTTFAVVTRLAVAGPIEGACVAVERLVAHLEASVSASSSSSAVRLYVGLVPLATTGEQALEAEGQELAARYAAKRHLSQVHVQLETFRPSAGVGSLADVWQALGSRAFEEGGGNGADYVVLWHRAHAFSDPAWARHLLDESTGLARALAASLGEADLAPALAGFGCVALLSEDRPREGFDLVLPQAHYAALGQRVLPLEWMVDAASGGPSVDRRLYYTYAKLNAARPSTRCGLLQGGEGILGTASAIDTDKGMLMSPPPPARLQINDEDATVRALASHLAGRLGHQKKGHGEHWNGSALAFLRRRGLPPSLDVVVPTYRVDMELLQGICGTAPANQGTLTYVVVDDPSKVMLDTFRTGGGDRPTPLLTVAVMQRRLSQTKPALVLVNSANMGVTRSRNRGIQASGAEWVVLQDDDVVPDVALLKAYSEAIARHSAEDVAGEAAATTEAEAEAERKPTPTPTFAPTPTPKPVVGFCGMIHFPEPYNIFTGALRMSGVTNAFEIAQLTPTPVWGCTANVCMRNGPWLHFQEDWEKSGGGEDIDFFLRLREVGRVRSAHAAAVTHPWWTNGRRSYWHFRMWGLGDGRLQKLYPEHCYRSAPCAIETLAVVMAALALAWLATYFGGLAGRHLTPQWVLQLAALIALGVLEVDMLGNVLCDRFLLRPVNSESLCGWPRAMAAMESALILTACELGRLQYHLCHRNGRLRDIGVRFDFYCGKIVSARRAWQVTYAVKFVGFVLYGVLAQVWLVMGYGRWWGWLGAVTALLHAGCVGLLVLLLCCE